MGLNSPEHQAKIDAMIDDVMGQLDRCVASPDAREAVIRLASKAAERLLERGCGR